MCYTNLDARTSARRDTKTLHATQCQSKSGINSNNKQLCYQHQTENAA